MPRFDAFVAAMGGPLQHHIALAGLSHGATRVTCWWLSAAGVVVDGQLLPADAVVVAMGPWSTVAAAGLPLPSFSHQRVHSVVLRPQGPVTAHALFTNIRMATGMFQFSLELLPGGSSRIRRSHVCGTLTLCASFTHARTHARSCTLAHAQTPRVTICGRA